MSVPLKRYGGMGRGLVYEERSSTRDTVPAVWRCMVEFMTDNRNRTVSKYAASLPSVTVHMGEAGCVAWMFDKKGVISYDPSLD